MLLAHLRAPRPSAAAGLRRLGDLGPQEEDQTVAKEAQIGVFKNPAPVIEQVSIQLPQAICIF